MHFGPATVKDGAYFFGTTQANVRRWLKDIPVSEVLLDGKTFFYMDGGFSGAELPSCLFLAGFDQLMLGYEKTENPFLPGELIRDIFTRSGIVRPAILVDGQVAGWWNLKNRKLSVTLFDDSCKEKVAASAGSLWKDLRKIGFR